MLNFQSNEHASNLATESSNPPSQHDLTGDNAVSNALQELDQRLSSLRKETQELQRKRIRLAVAVDAPIKGEDGAPEVSAKDTSSDVSVAQTERVHVGLNLFGGVFRGTCDRGRVYSVRSSSTQFPR